MLFIFWCFLPQWNFQWVEIAKYEHVIILAAWGKDHNGFGTTTEAKTINKHQNSIPVWGWCCCCFGGIFFFSITPKLEKPTFIEFSWKWRCFFFILVFHVLNYFNTLYRSMHLSLNFANDANTLFCCCCGLNSKIINGLMEKVSLDIHFLRNNQ